MGTLKGHYWWLVLPYDSEDTEPAKKSKETRGCRLRKYEVVKKGEDLLITHEKKLMGGRILRRRRKFQDSDVHKPWIAASRKEGREGGVSTDMKAPH